MSPEIFAKVTFFRTEEGGLKRPTPANFFGCPFLMDEQMNDCRLVLTDVGSVNPGRTIEVPIAFLVPKLVVDRLKVGRKFKLWHMGIIAEGEILNVLIPTGSAPIECDHYEEAKSIAIALDEEGYESVAIEIRDAMKQGSTGTEIFMRLRFCLTPLLNEKELSNATAARVRTLHARLDEALR